MKKDKKDIQKSSSKRIDNLKNDLKLLKQILDSIPDAVIFYSYEWRFVAVNKNALKIIGKKQKDLIGKKIWEIFPESLHTETNKQFLTTAKTKKKRSFETYSHIVKKWFHVQIGPTKNGFMVTFHDISQRKKIEEELKESEKKFRATFYQTTIGMSLTDSDANWIEFNNVYPRMFGYSKQELMKMHPFQITHPDDRERSRRLFLQLKNGEIDSYVDERRYVHKNGSIIYGIIYASAIKDENGKLIYIVAVVEDITQRKKAEQSLQVSEERFRTLIEKSTDVIQLISAEGKVLYTSESVKQVLGYTPEELLGQSGTPYLHPDDAPLFYKIFSSILEKPGSQAKLEYRLKHKNGSWIWVEATGVNYLDKPSVKAIVGNFRDITQRKLFERQKDEFLANASHELKTPVTSLKVFTQVLQSRFAKAGDEKTASLLAKMDTQINKLTSFIQDLLDINKAESGRFKLQRDFFNFDDLIEEIVDEVQRTTEIHIIVHKGKIRVPVYGDRERIGQVLTNFLTNAIKYSANSSRIIVDAISNKKEVTVCVKDFGVGIPHDDLPHVFERFFRVSGEVHDTIPGMGIGLSISYEIIKRHGGKIWVESTYGKGSSFYFSLPIKNKYFLEE